MSSDAGAGVTLSFTSQPLPGLIRGTLSNQSGTTPIVLVANDIGEKLSGEELRRSYRAGDIHSPRIPVTEALQIEMRHFIECVRDGKKPRSDGEAGLRVVRALEAGMRSLRTGGARVAYRPDAVRA